MARPPRIPVWLSNERAVVYFITICVVDRRRVLNDPRIFTAVTGFCFSSTTWQTLAAVAMPDHLHALVSPFNRDAAVIQFSAGLKRFVRRSVAAE